MEKYDDKKWADMGVNSHIGLFYVNTAKMLIVKECILDVLSVLGYPECCYYAEKSELVYQTDGIL